ADGSVRRIPSSDYGCARRWQVRWRDESGRQRKRNFSKRDGKNPERDASAFDAKMKAALDAGTALDLAAGKMIVREYAALYRRDLLHRNSTAERVDRVFRLHVDPLPLGRMPMTQVRSSHMRAWVKDRSQVLAPSTLSVVWSNLTSMFSAAVTDRVIGISPCAGVKLPGIPGHDHYIPAAEQVHELAAALPERYSAIVYLAAGCGLRGAEITGLELESVDFLQREIDVSQQLVCVTGVEPYLGPPKTRGSARTVEMPAVTIAALARHIELFPPPEVEIWDRTDSDQRKHHRRTARLLFVTFAGRPIYRATWAHLWAPAARRAGIPRGIGLHCLRHYFATLLIHHGAGVKRVQLALGHSTPMITLNTYAGEWPDTDDQARVIVDSVLGNVPCVCPVRRAVR
ncbi:MAG TPA: tyrosine-type recombinase/integrase, partial [Gemmataceae bacterium]|nr:tyrosine-type recombinase/integrase [Gemmataceae bacterium]